MRAKLSYMKLRILKMKRKQLKRKQNLINHMRL